MAEPVELSKEAILALAGVTNFVGAAMMTWLITWRYSKSKVQAAIVALLFGGGMIAGQRVVGASVIDMSWTVAKDAIFVGALAAVAGLAVGAGLVWRSTTYLEIDLGGGSGSSSNEEDEPEDEDGGLTPAVVDRVMSDDDPRAEDERIPIEKLTGEEIKEAVDFLESVGRSTEPEDIEEIAYDLAVTNTDEELGSAFATGDEQSAIDRSVLAPNDMHERSKWHTRNGDFYQILTAKSLPRFLSPGWLIPFTLSSDDLRLSMHVKPRNTDSVKGRLQKRLTQIESAIQKKQRKGRTDTHKDAQEKKEINRLLQKVIQGTTKIYDVSLYAEVRGHSKEAMENAAERVRRKGRAKGLDLVPVEGQQSDAQKALAPLGEDNLANTNAVQLEALQQCFAFVEPAIDDNKGILLGFDSTKRPLIVDRWGISGHSKAVTGKVGSGKTYGVKMAQYRRMLIDDEVRTVIFDPLGDDFVDFARQLGGTVIEFGGGYRVNPLEIEASEKDAETDEDPFQVKLRNVVRLFRTFLEEKDGMVAQEEGVLTQAIYYAYLKKGITPDPATFHRESPIIDDVIEGIEIIGSGGLTDDEVVDLIPDECGDIRLEDDGELMLDIDTRRGAQGGVYEAISTIRDPPKQHQKIARKLEPKFESFKRGNINSNLNGHSNIDLESDIVVFDMSKFADTGAMPLIQHAMLNWAYDQARHNDGKIDVTFEEAHYLLGREGARNLINLFIRHARHFNCGITLISQTAEEFLKNDDVQEIYDNCDIKQMFYQENVGDEVIDYFGLSSDEVRDIQHAARGEDSDHSECLLSTSKHGRRWVECYTGKYEHHILDDDLDPWKYLINEEKLTHLDRSWAEDKQEEATPTAVYAPLEAILATDTEREEVQADPRKETTLNEAAAMADGGAAGDD